MEQQSLHEQLDPGPTHFNPLAQSLLSGTSLGVLSEPIDAFRCPSDNGPETNTVRDQFPWGTADTGRPATSNYVAANDTWRTQNGLNSGPVEQRGLFRENNANSFKNIVDGSSNVIALGERKWRTLTDTGRQYNTGAAIIFGIRRRNARNHRADQVAAGCGGINLNIDSSRGWTRQGFSSQHPGGANFALADASVRFIGEDIQLDKDSTTELGTACDDVPTTRDVDTIFEYLIGIEDGETVGEY
jgi:prepilin-type processing-associated H-X9-DG protein